MRRRHLELRIEKTSFSVLAEWGGGRWHHGGAKEWWEDWSEKRKENARVSGTYSESRYGSDECRRGRTMRAVTTHLFSIVASLCWRNGVAERPGIGRVKGLGRGTQNLAQNGGR